MTTIQHKNSIITVMHVINSLPGTLTAVGIWMIYADAWDKRDRSIRTGAMQLIFVLQVIFLVVIGLAFGYVLLTARRAVLLILVLAGLVIAMYGLMAATVHSIRNTARTCVPDSRYVKALAIIEFVTGGANLLSIISGRAEDGFSSIMSCALAFLLGAVLLKYKTFMDEINCKYVQMETETVTPPAEVEEVHIPAWKRVQMEKEDSEK